MNLTELRCKNCGAALSGQNIDTRLGVARCGHCDALFLLDHLTGPGESPPPKRIRPKVAMPNNVQTERLGNTLTITRRWFTPVALFLVFFCVFWNGFMIVWHGIAIGTGMWIMSLFGLIHTAVGVGLIYVTAALFVNKTVIQVQRGMMTVQHGPIPWKGNQTLTTDDLVQFYCREKLHHGKNGTSSSYSLCAVDKNQRRVDLMTYMLDCDQALYLEQQIEEFLGIEDQPVAGEVNR